MPNRYEGPKVIAALSPHIVMPAKAGIHLRGNDIAEHTLSWGCVKSHLFYSKSLPAACIASTESDFLGLFAQPQRGGGGKWARRVEGAALGLGGIVVIVIVRF